MKKFIAFLISAAVVANCLAAGPTFTVGASHPTGNVSPNFFGLMTEEINHSVAFAKEIKVLFISIGTAEGRMTAGGHNFHLALKQAGIKHVFYESPGTAHEIIQLRNRINHRTNLVADP